MSTLDPYKWSWSLVIASKGDEIINPTWPEESSNDWRDLIPQELRDMWPQLQIETKASLYLVAKLGFSSPLKALPAGSMSLVQA